MTNTSNERTDLFKNECKVINLRYEYVGYTGTEQWAIVSELSEEEMCNKYGDIVGVYSPYVLLTTEQGAAIMEYQNNEAKYRMRNLRSGHLFDVSDGEFEEHHPELAVYENVIEWIDKRNKITRLKEVLNSLPEIQKRRLIKHFFYNKSSREIAKEEGVNYSAVDKSILSGIEKIKKIF